MIKFETERTSNEESIKRGGTPLTFFFLFKVTEKGERTDTLTTKKKPEEMNEGGLALKTE